MSNRSRWIRRLVILALLAAAVVLLRLTLFKSNPIPVTVFRAATGRVDETVTNSKSGTVKTRRRATLSPEIGGRVVELPVRKGDRVRRNQLLLRLADEDHRAQLELQKRSLDAAVATEKEACAASQQAERDLARSRTLVEQGVLPREQLDQVESRRNAAVAACEAAGARARQAEAAVELARVNRAKTVLRAPFDAVLAEISTELGEWITPAPPGVPIPPVMELIDSRAIYVSAPLDEVDIGKVRVGMPVRITMDAYSGHSFQGRLTRVAPYVLDVQEQNRTLEIEVDFDDPSLAPTLLPGTSADVEVILDARDGVLRVPSYALIRGSRVMVVRDGRLVGVEVKTGLKNWEFTEIVSGLSSGEPVVVSLERVEVQEGASVRIQEETLK